MVVMVVTTVCGSYDCIRMTAFHTAAHFMRFTVHGAIGAVDRSGLLWGLLGLHDQSIAKKMHHPMKLYQTTPPLEPHRPTETPPTHNNRNAPKAPFLRTFAA